MNSAIDSETQWNYIEHLAFEKLKEINLKRDYNMICVLRTLTKLKTPPKSFPKLNLAVFESCKLCDICW